MQKMNRIILRRGKGKPGIEAEGKVGLQPYEIGANTEDGNIYYCAVLTDEKGEKMSEIRCIMAGEILTNNEIDEILNQ